MNLDDYKRYGRQLILPIIGKPGQIKLKDASVLVVGAGGLGSPVILYLAAAGIGTLGIVDHDTVDVGNLHRQIIHDETRLGINKAISAKEHAQQLNSTCTITAYDAYMTSDNALDIVQRYDVIVDCSDNVATRYLVNDVTVHLNKVLVSGSAIRTEGQVCVYHYQGGPCYRCLFPEPPPPETVTNCSDGGVLGPVCGVIGSLQAVQVIKVITDQEILPQLLMYSAMHASVPFRCVKLRGRNVKCAVCGDVPTIRTLVDSVQYCGTGGWNDRGDQLNLLKAEERISCEEFHNVRKDSGQPYVLLDVRNAVQFDICHLEESKRSVIVRYKGCRCAIG
jgi:adenylyltransferase/sulfurtransferase